MLTLIRSVNPSLSVYDPLAQNPAQRAAQSASLAAAVAGLFFGTNVALAANGGALLVNMHSLIFPGTEFRSAFAQSAPDHKDQTVLCGNKTPSAARTELAFLWATRIPDAAAPEVSLPKPEHLPIGAKSSFPIAVKARDWSLAARVQDWKLVSTADEKISVPVAAKVNTQTKTIEIDPQDPKLKPGDWKLAGIWDWSPLSAGEIDLRPLSQFDKAHLTPDSQDRLTQGFGQDRGQSRGRRLRVCRKAGVQMQRRQVCAAVAASVQSAERAARRTRDDHGNANRPAIPGGRQL